MNILKNKDGITLIALIITVIVMLILAGVAISVLTDDGGLFEKTRGAAEAYENSAEKEAKQIDDLMNNIDQYLAGIPTSKPETDGSWNGTINTPKLATGMTAVYWNDGGQEIELTSSSSKSEWNKWYNYTAQTGSTETAGSGTSKWANAITKDKNGNVTGYWVWIPRYEYKLTTSSKTIDINFISTKTTTPSSSDYRIHPVFLNDAENGGWDSELPGFWVAKYPAGFQKSTINTSGTLQNGSDELKLSNLNYSQSTTYVNAIGQTPNTSTKISYPVFKPLTYAYNLINVDSIYRMAREMVNSTEFYGISNADTHFLKNSEWGAVVYLTWSKYGRNGTEPKINNVNLKNKDSKNIYAVTGIYANGTGNSDTNGSVTGNAYNTSAGQLGSSTGNITGVYDLNGCIWEYVSAYANNAHTHLQEYGASIISAEKKYKNVYAKGSSDTSANNYAANNFKGDAIRETSTSGNSSTSWNGDYSVFPYSDDPYMIRGGIYDYGTRSGIFAFGHDDYGGLPNNNRGFRYAIVGTL